MAKKSEKKRQAAAQKRRDKAEERKKRAAAKAYEASLDGQLANLAILARDNAQTFSLLLQGFAPEAVAEKVGIDVRQVHEVYRAHMKLPDGIRKLLEENPQTLGNSEAVEAIRYGCKNAKRGAVGGRVDLSAAVLDKLVGIMQKGQNPS